MKELKNKVFLYEKWSEKRKSSTSICFCRKKKKLNKHMKSGPIKEKVVRNR